MNKAFEMIINSIKELADYNGDAYIDSADIIEIVQEVAEEYNGGLVSCSGCKDCKNKECEHYGKV